MRTLELDDFNVGMLIVGMGRPAREEPVWGGFMGTVITGTCLREDHSYRGSLYIVCAIDLPFLVLRRIGTTYGPCGPSDYESKPHTHDTRMGFRWGEPSKEMVDAVWPNTFSEKVVQ